MTFKQSSDHFSRQASNLTAQSSSFLLISFTILLAFSSQLSNLAKTFIIFLCMQSQQCAFRHTKKYFCVRSFRSVPIVTCSSLRRLVTVRVQSLMMTSINTISVHSEALMMKAAINSPFMVRNGLSVDWMLSEQMTSMMGSSEVAARMQTATQKMLQEGVGGITVLIAQMKLMQVATISVEEPIFWPRTWSPEVEELQRNSTSPRKERKKMGMHSWMMVPREALSMGIRMMALQQEYSSERSSFLSSGSLSSSGCPLGSCLSQLTICLRQKRQFLRRSYVFSESIRCCFSRVQ